MIIAYQLQYINTAANSTCKCCKQFNKVQHGEQRVRNARDILLLKRHKQNFNVLGEN